MNLPELIVDYPEGPRQILNLLGSLITSSILPVNLVLRVPEQFWDIGEGGLAFTLNPEALNIRELWSGPVKSHLEGSILEFFGTLLVENFQEFIGTFQTQHGHTFDECLVRKLIDRSYDQRSLQRDAVSRLLAKLNSEGLITHESMSCSIDSLIWQASQAKIDCLQADNYLARFIARGIYDEALPPACIHDFCLSGTASEPLELSIVKNSAVFLKLYGENVWGPVAPNQLKNAVQLIISEWVINQDIAEAERCVAELQSPLFLHELVKRAGIDGISGNNEVLQKTAKLVTLLKNSGLLGEEAVIHGLELLEERLGDLEIDVGPAARTAFGTYRAAILNGGPQGGNSTNAQGE